MSAWQVVGPTGHAVAIYDRESTAVRVAEQLGYRAFPWSSERAAEPVEGSLPQDAAVEPLRAVSGPKAGPRAAGAA